METLRDTAFGKLVRLFSRYKWMKYNEEKDTSVWPTYLKKESKKRLEASSPQSQRENDDLEAFGLYAVMSQCSTRARRMSSLTPTSKDEQNQDLANQPLIISWSGSDDSEVGFIPAMCYHWACMLIAYRILKTGVYQKRCASAC